jgi:hypothetical protein
MKNSIFGEFLFSTQLLFFSLEYLGPRKFHSLEKRPPNAYAISVLIHVHKLIEIICVGKENRAQRHLAFYIFEASACLKCEQCFRTLGF